MEKMSRRKFLKLGTLCAAGVSAAAVGVSSAANASAPKVTYKRNDNRLKGTAMGMVIDMRQIDEEKIMEMRKPAMRSTMYRMSAILKAKLNGFGRKNMKICLPAKQLSVWLKNLPIKNS